MLIIWESYIGAYTYMGHYIGVTSFLRVLYQWIWLNMRRSVCYIRIAWATNHVNIPVIHNTLLRREMRNSIRKSYLLSVR